MTTYILLIFIILFWLSLLVVPAWFHYEPLTKLVHDILSLICHQIPERSYFIGNYQLPVCARCIGVYLGILAGFLVYPFFKPLNNKKPMSFKFIPFFLAPLVIDGVLQSAHLYDSGNLFRTLTGIIASTPIAFYLLPVLNYLCLFKKNI